MTTMREEAAAGGNSTTSSVAMATARVGGVRSALHFPQRSYRFNHSASIADTTKQFVFEEHDLLDVSPLTLHFVRHSAESAFCIQHYSELAATYVLSVAIWFLLLLATGLVVSFKTRSNEHTPLASVIVSAVSLCLQTAVVAYLLIVEWRSSQPLRILLEPALHEILPMEHSDTPLEDRLSTSRDDEAMCTTSKDLKENARKRILRVEIALITQFAAMFLIFFSFVMRKRPEDCQFQFDTPTLCSHVSMHDGGVMAIYAVGIGLVPLRFFANAITICSMTVLYVGAMQIEDVAFVSPAYRGAMGILLGVMAVVSTWLKRLNEIEARVRFLDYCELHAQRAHSQKLAAYFTSIAESMFPERYATRIARGETLLDRFDDGIVLNATPRGFAMHAVCLAPSDTAVALQAILVRLDNGLRAFGARAVKSHSFGDEYVAVVSTLPRGERGGSVIWEAEIPALVEFLQAAVSSGHDWQVQTYGGTKWVVDVSIASGAVSIGSLGALHNIIIHGPAVQQALFLQSKALSVVQRQPVGVRVFPLCLCPDDVVPLLCSPQFTMSQERDVSEVPDDTDSVQVDFIGNSVKAEVSDPAQISSLNATLVDLQLVQLHISHSKTSPSSTNPNPLSLVALAGTREPSTIRRVAAQRTQRAQSELLCMVVGSGMIALSGNRVATSFSPDATMVDDSLRVSVQSCSVEEPRFAQSRLSERSIEIHKINSSAGNSRIPQWQQIADVTQHASSQRTSPSVPATIPDDAHPQQQQVTSLEEIPQRIVPEVLQWLWCLPLFYFSDTTHEPDYRAFITKQSFSRLRMEFAVAFAVVIALCSTVAVTGDTRIGGPNSTLMWLLLAAASAVCGLALTELARSLGASQERWFGASVITAEVSFVACFNIAVWVASDESFIHFAVILMVAILLTLCLSRERLASVWMSSITDVVCAAPLVVLALRDFSSTMAGLCVTIQLSMLIGAGAVRGMRDREQRIRFVIHFEADQVKQQLQSTADALMKLLERVIPNPVFAALLNRSRRATAATSTLWKTDFPGESHQSTLIPQCHWAVGTHFSSKVHVAAVLLVRITPLLTASWWAACNDGLRFITGDIHENLGDVCTVKSCGDSVLLIDDTTDDTIQQCAGLFTFVARIHRRHQHALSHASPDGRQPVPFMIQSALAYGTVVIGVLGTTSVSFDCIGAPVTVASHLARASPAGCTSVATTRFTRNLLTWACFAQPSGKALVSGSMVEAGPEGEVEGFRFTLDATERVAACEVTVSRAWQWRCAGIKMPLSVNTIDFDSNSDV